MYAILGRQTQLLPSPTLPALPMVNTFQWAQSRELGDEDIFNNSMIIYTVL